MARDTRNGEIKIEAESLLASYIKDKIEGSQHCLSVDNSIFRTPSILARHNEKAYTPNHFSIGPFHRKPELKAGERIKFKYLQDVLSRSAEKKADAKWTECLDSIKEVGNKARNCYAEILEDENFVEMLVVDGCFIIELFRKYGKVEQAKDDPIFSQSCMLQFLHHDLILLENQIPWFVLEILFNKTKDPSETNSLIQLALDFFSNKFTSHTPIFDPKLFENQGVKHILDLLWLMLVLPSEEVKKYQRNQRSNKKKLGWQPIPSATRLEEAGVRFIHVNANANSILDLEFINGVLEIPSLLIQETTETIFRNLISYEQCLPNCRPIFTSYAKIMDNLIDTTNDVEILCKEGIFDNWLSPEDATQLFNKLYNDTYLKEFYYGELCNEVNRFYKQLRPRWCFAFVNNYITKPWAIVAIIYAIIILFLTFWQAIK